MSREQLEVFRELVWNDEALLDQLRVVEGRDEFCVRLLGMGRAAGYEFEREEIELIIRESYLSWMQRWV